MFQTKVVEKIKTHILCSKTYSLKSCHLWDNVEKSAGHIIHWCMRIALWIPKVTNTYSEYKKFISFPSATMVAQTCLNVICTMPVLLLLLLLFVLLYYSCQVTHSSVLYHPNSTSFSFQSVSTFLFDYGHSI